MKVIFFLLCSKFNVDFKTEKNLLFSKYLSQIGCVKLSLLRREYWSSAVNVLTNTYKALHLTKTDLFRLNYLQSDHKIW